MTHEQRIVPVFPNRGNPRWEKARFILQILMGLALLGYIFFRAPAANSQEALATCKQLASNDGMVTVNGATYGDPVTCPNILVTRSADQALGIACTLTNGVMGCSIGEPLAEVPTSDTRTCTATALPSLDDLLSAEMRVTIWVARETCTPLPIGNTPHRVVKVNANGFSVCIMPGNGCAAISSLGTKALTRLGSMGIGGTVGKMLEEFIGIAKKKDEKA